jgi:hypothetical protein
MVVSQMSREKTVRRIQAEGLAVFPATVVTG